MKTKFITITILLFFAIFTINAQSWIQVGADINGAEDSDNSGKAISMSADGSTIIIGAKMHDGGAGHARVFKNNDGTWEQMGSPITGGSFDEFGDAVSISSDGTIIAIGSIYYGSADSQGHVEIYQYTGSYWQSIGEIVGELGDYSGCSVSLNADGTKLAIGAYINDAGGYEAGCARVFQYESGTTWTQIGSDIQGIADERAGETVCLNYGGDTLAVGAYYNDTNGNNSGCVRIYENNSGTWEQIGSNIYGEGTEDEFGTSISFSNDGSIVAIGSLWNSGNGFYAGHVRVFQNNANTWQQIGNDIDGEGANNNSGTVSLNSNGSLLVVGAYGNSANGTSSGRVKIYENVSGTWTQLGENLDGNADFNFFGAGVTSSSDGLIIAGGATCSNGYNGGKGYVRVFELSYSPLITTQPNNQINVCPNADISFSIGGGNINTYQWQVNEGAGFNDITNVGVYSNATTATLNITGVTAEMNNFEYKCFVTNNNGNNTSEIATITIDAENPTIICVANQTKNTQEGETFYAVSGDEFDAQANDNCEIASVTNSFNNLSTLDEAEFPIGSTVVEWTVTDVMNNSETCSFEVHINEFVGIESLQQNTVSVYPNPSNGIFNLEISARPSSVSSTNVSITDITGKIVYNQQLRSNKEQIIIDISTQVKGIYLLKIQTETSVYIEKIIRL